EVAGNRSRRGAGGGGGGGSRRAEREGARRDVPALRIIPEPLWTGVQTRLAASHRAYLRATKGARHGRPANGVESRYLLTGLAACGRCGGSLVVQSRASGKTRRFVYRCSYSYYRGLAVCPNRVLL